MEEKYIEDLRPEDIKKLQKKGIESKMGYILGRFYVCRVRQGNR